MIKRTIVAIVATSMLAPALAQAQRYGLAPSAGIDARVDPRDPERSRQGRSTDRTDARDLRSDRAEPDRSYRRDRQNDRLIARGEPDRDIGRERPLTPRPPVLAPGSGGYAGRGRDAEGRVGYDRPRRADWDRGWRNDARYDWNRYRTYDRSAYRLPRYVAPPGWNRGYRRFSVGVVLSVGLFGREHWLSDPYAYRLPDAYGPYRWIRYYDDALLIDLRSGYVVDTVYGIFY